MKLLGQQGKANGRLILGRMTAFVVKMLMRMAISMLKQ